MWRWSLALLLPVIAAAQASPAGVYHADPAHAWNLLHEALFVRHGTDGAEYGRDRIEPLLWRGSRHLLGGASHERLLSTLAQFNRGGHRLVADPLKRAMLQRDLWLVFSWLEHSHDEFYNFGGHKADWERQRVRLRRPLAEAIGALGLTAREIASLPDNYAAAVASRTFAPAFDPQHPDKPYLPADLFDANSGWVSLGRGRDLIAGHHLLDDNPFTTSAFLIFLKLPSGHEATRSYVERLGKFTGPRFVPTRSEPAQFPNFNPAIPQFPAGTQVALVRRALLVTAAHEIAVSPIAEQVQVRVYRQVPQVPTEKLGLASNDPASHAWQSVHEFVFGREALFAGRAGGLRAVEDGDGDFRTGFATHGVDPFDTLHADPASLHLPRPRRVPSTRIDRCFSCHNLPGVFSLNAFAQDAGRLVPMPAADVLAAGVAWKRGRDDWTLLKQLLRETSAGR